MAIVKKKKNSRYESIINGMVGSIVDHVLRLPHKQQRLIMRRLRKFKVGNDK
jgi:hypothetical protein